MPDLHIRTLIITCTAIVLICLMAFAVVWGQNRERFPATSYWLAGFWLQLIALGLLLLRGIIPDFLSIFGNFIGGSGAIVLLRKGLEKFFGEKRQHRGEYLLIAGFLGIHVYCTYVTPNLSARVINYSVVQMHVFAQCAMVVWRGRNTAMSPVGPFLVFVLLAGVALNAMRIGGAIIQPAGDDFFQSNLVEASLFLVYGTLMMLITFGLLMLINRSLQLSLQRDLEILRESETALRISEQNLKHAEAMGQTGHWALNLETMSVMASDQAVKIYGAKAGDLDYEFIRNARLEEGAAKVDEAFSKLVHQGAACDLEFKIRAVDTGEIRDIHSRAVHDQDRHTVFGILRDVSAQKMAERGLLEKESMFRLAVETSPVGFWIADTTGQLLDVNRAYTALSGYSREELLCMNIASLDATETTEQTRQRIESVIRDGYATFEAAHRRKDGSVWPAEVVTSYSPALGGRFFVFLRDITEKRSLDELNWHHANFDRLTDLPNRALLFDRLSIACAKARRNAQLVAVLFLDLDGFKSVNDTYGHEAGDAVLIEAARRWSACVRSSDTVARLGGDEFAIVLGGLEQADDAAVLAQKAITEMQRAIELADGHSCHVGTSIGVSLYPNDALEMDTLITLADEAMYVSKHRGKNTFTFAHAPVGAPAKEGPWVQFTADEQLGMGLMDEQHRHLVDLLNQINHAINASDPQSDVNAMFDELVAYTVMHFASELALMQRYHYPELAQHDREHTRLVQEVKALVSRFKEGAQLATLQMLKDWLVGHIHISDRKLAQFLIGQGCQ